MESIMRHYGDDMAEGVPARPDHGPAADRRSSAPGGLTDGRVEAAGLPMFETSPPSAITVMKGNPSRMLVMMTAGEPIPVYILWVTL